MRFTKMPVDTFKNIQINAGMIATGFNPATGEVTGQIGATTGGNQVSIVPTLSDYGADIDNCPTGTKEMQNIDDWEVTASGSFVTVNTLAARKLLGAADIDPNDATHVIPRRDLIDADFGDIWIVGDYSDDNTEESGGFIAIHLMNVLNTGGFVMQTSNKGKGTFSYSYKAHFSMAAQTTVPAEIYIQGSAEETPKIELDTHSLTLVDGQTYTFTPTVQPTGQQISWSTSASGKVSVDNGVITAVDEGTAIITATITVNDVVYNDTCTVIVEAAEG